MVRKHLKPGFIQLNLLPKSYSVAHKVSGGMTDVVRGPRILQVLGAKRLRSKP